MLRLDTVQIQGIKKDRMTGPVFLPVTAKAAESLSSCARHGPSDFLTHSDCRRIKQKRASNPPILQRRRFCVPGKSPQVRVPSAQ